MLIIRLITLLTLCLITSKHDMNAVYSHILHMLVNLRLLDTYAVKVTQKIRAPLGIESKPGENFLSLQCKDKGEGGGLKILLVKIAIHK